MAKILSVSPKEADGSFVILTDDGATHPIAGDAYNADMPMPQVGDEYPPLPMKETANGPNPNYKPPVDEPSDLAAGEATVVTLNDEEIRVATDNVLLSIDFDKMDGYAIITSSQGDDDRDVIAVPLDPRFVLIAVSKLDIPTKLALDEANRRCDELQVKLAAATLHPSAPQDLASIASLDTLKPAPTLEDHAEQNELAKSGRAA